MLQHRLLLEHVIQIRRSDKRLERAILEIPIGCLIRVGAYHGDVIRYRVYIGNVLL